MYAQIHPSPRIIVALDQASSLSAVKLAHKCNAYTTPYEDINTLADKIATLDEASDQHCIIIQGPKDKLSDLADKVGYDYLYIQTSNANYAQKAIKTKEKQTPSTDAYLQRLTPDKAGMLYKLMMDVDTILKKHHLTYWATCGTLLGAVRHKGLIPWDDDLDICMYEQDIPKLLELKETFSKQGLQISQLPSGWYKIYFTNGQKIKINNDDDQCYEWRFPAVDIFPVHTNKQNQVEHTHEATRNLWPSEYFIPSELQQPFQQLSFGPMSIPVPHNLHTILERFYGKDWNRITYAAYDHEHEKNTKKIKVDLVDRSTIPYTLPTSIP